jgi:hypothetical protein
MHGASATAGASGTQVGMSERPPNSVSMPRNVHHLRYQMSKSGIGIGIGIGGMRW